MSNYFKKPEVYVKGQGIRYRYKSIGIKIEKDFFYNLIGDSPSKCDLYKMLDFFKVLKHNAYHSQTLVVMTSNKGRKFARPMQVKDIARYIGKTNRSAYRLLGWLKEKDLVRRSENKSLIVNPDKILLR